MTSAYYRYRSCRLQTYFDVLAPSVTGDHYDTPPSPSVVLNGCFPYMCKIWFYRLDYEWVAAGPRICSLLVTIQPCKVGTNGLPRKTPSSAASTFLPCFLTVEM